MSCEIIIILLWQSVSETNIAWLQTNWINSLCSLVGWSVPHFLRLSICPFVWLSVLPPFHPLFRRNEGRMNVIGTADGRRGFKKSWRLVNLSHQSLTMPINQRSSTNVLRCPSLSLSVSCKPFLSPSASYCAFRYHSDTLFPTLSPASSFSPGEAMHYDLTTSG